MKTYTDEELDVISIANDLDIKVKHFIPQQGNIGGMTVAYVRPKGSKIMEIATAICIPSDQYNKKIGRIKALSNLLNVKSILIPIDAKANTVDELNNMFLSYVEDIFE